MLNGLDLFSGIGGIALGLQEWVRPIAYCECEEYSQRVLLSRMQDGQLPIGPIWDDVQTLRREHLPAPVDIITGGFPCQDISVAGNGSGLEGKRSGLFFEIVRLACEFRPQFIFLENVPAITIRGLDRVLLEFTALGYDCRWTIVSAAEVGAPHLRERWFLLAHANGLKGGNKRENMERGNAIVGERQAIIGNDGFEKYVANSHSARELQPQRGITNKWGWIGNGGQAVANSNGSGFKKHWRESTSGKKLPTPQLDSWWKFEPNVGRVATRVPFRVDRLRGLGNACPPQQYREAFKRLMGIE